MRRVVLALVSTVAVLVLLLGYKTTSRQLGTPAAIQSAPQQKTVTTSGKPGVTSAAARTVTGPVVQTRWGPVQVQITLRNGKVTDVKAVQYPSGNSRDQEINSTALPILRSAVLQAQSARIDMVSGATVTSEGYLQSLQAALDRAHA